MVTTGIGESPGHLALLNYVTNRKTSTKTLGSNNNTRTLWESNEVLQRTGYDIQRREVRVATHIEDKDINGQELRCFEVKKV
jgi:hypothetical protein